MVRGHGSFLLVVVLVVMTVANAPGAYAQDGAVEPPPAEVPAGVPAEVPVETTAPPAPAPPPPQVPKKRVRRVDVRKKITFPVVFPASYGSSFGACRDGCNREHHGVDIMVWDWKGAPVVAAHTGFVIDVTYDGNLQGCAVKIRGLDRWITRYVHLNNDTPGTDDGEAAEASCLAPGIEVGSYVEEGQLIGWMGDSGNAETTPAHLHFEIRTPRGLPVDPYRSLRAAKRIRFTKLGADGGPIESAAAISRIVYPEGSTVAAVTTEAEMSAETFALPWDVQFAGPVLVTEDDELSATTREELLRLAPEVIVVLERDRPLQPIVLEELAGMAVVETAPFPTQVEHPPIYPDGIEPAPEDLPAYPDDTVPPTEEVVGEPPYFVVLVDDAEEPSPEIATMMHELADVVPTMRLIHEDDIARDRGRSPYRGPGRSGRRGTLYYSVGDGYELFPRDEPPQVPPGYGIVLVANGELTGPTLTFLRSLATTPIMPLWR